ncbi:MULTISPECIES: hypothetical protein [Sphingobium]|uniref:hypothetical protein n=1 Tax=Sphingobium TaxID=165695 RepID=UPI00159BFB5A|nr:hypothetical protein [Sphingobium sp. 15-1]
MIRYLFCAAAMAASSVAFAQTDAPGTGVTAPSAVSVASRTLPASTLISVTPLSEISSKHVEVGQKVAFAVVNDVTENGIVVIPRGAAVEGTISWKTGKAVGGKSGKFEVNFDKINVRGHDFALRGTHRQEGKGNTVAAVFATWLVSGRSATMLPGQFVNAFTAEAITY